LKKSYAIQKKFETQGNPQIRAERRPAQSGNQDAEDAASEATEDVRVLIWKIAG
jgi:hypothetical protein